MFARLGEPRRRRNFRQGMSFERPASSRRFPSSTMLSFFFGCASARLGSTRRRSTVEGAGGGTTHRSILPAYLTWRRVMRRGRQTYTPKTALLDADVPPYVASIILCFAIIVSSFCSGHVVRRSFFFFFSQTALCIFQGALHLLSDLLRAMLQ